MHGREMFFVGRSGIPPANATQADHSVPPANETQADTRMFILCFFLWFGQQKSKSVNRTLPANFAEGTAAASSCPTTACGTASPPGRETVQLVPEPPDKRGQIAYLNERIRNRRTASLRTANRRRTIKNQSTTHCPQLHVGDCKKARKLSSQDIWMQCVKLWNIHRPSAAPMRQPSKCTN